MKRIAFCAVLAALPLFADSTVPPPEAAMVEKLFVPQGYDDNDMIEVVVSGTFSDSCHQVGEAITRVDEKARTVTIMQLAYREPGIMCLQMISPYTHTVRIGHLNQGPYTFKIANNPSVTRVLNVKHAEVSTTDDFLYPPVDFAEVTPAPDGKKVLVVKGRYPLMKTGCMKTQNAIIDFQSQDTLVVQPKATIVENAPEGCDSQFENRYELPYDMTGKVLIHVRALNGQSYNRVEIVN